MNQPPEVLFQSELHSLDLLHRGKVRDIYAVDDERLLVVATDRLSAFDVILPDPIPGKGRILTAISNFWFNKTADIVRNHLSRASLEDVLPDPEERQQVAGRATVVRRLKPLPVEAIVRGYIIGSGWKEYQQTGGVCGIDLPAGLKMADRLPQPIFTPSTKAAVGSHDENIGFDRMSDELGADIAEQVRVASLQLYTYASRHARERGIVIADTKFEFGLDRQGRVVLIDEALTPDSSRFWPASTWRPGSSPPSFDKQYVRDYLETLDWDKTAPGPRLPDYVIQKTAEKYREAYRLLTDGAPL
ncbi:MAG: phosphoribosylaminoimidazolesuccinocarboxamide synthase [Gammaproteobacteria bacterium]|jgi:phosphoribosylaminoimidazole-succinocarboxamide synthase